MIEAMATDKNAQEWYQVFPLIPDASSVTPAKAPGDCPVERTLRVVAGR